MKKNEMDRIFSLLLYVLISCILVTCSFSPKLIEEPIISPDMPANDYIFGPLEVSISCPTEGTKIRYTINGGSPTKDTGILYTGPFIITKPSSICAIAYDEKTVSGMSSKYYFVVKKIPDPQFNLSEGIYSGTQSIEISNDAGGLVWIMYTLDGTTPSKKHGFVYTEPIEITKTTTIRAIALFKDGVQNLPPNDEGYGGKSDFVSVRYEIQGSISSPVYSLESDEYSTPQLLTISCPTPGATIRYTVDGTDPSCEHGELYNNPINITYSHPVKAIAYIGSETSQIAGTAYWIKGPSGGIVFYSKEVPSDGWQYLEGCMYTGSERPIWGNVGETVGTESSIGSGLQNTDKIVNQFTNINTVAKLCKDLSYNGYDDWFLPSIGELTTFFTNVCEYTMENNYPGIIWSSTEYDMTYAETVLFSEPRACVTGLNKTWNTWARILLVHEY